jgi:hypothetical protein
MVGVMAAALLFAACGGRSATEDDVAATQPDQFENTADTPIMIIGNGADAVEISRAEPSVDTATPAQLELVDSVISANGVDAGFVVLSHALGRGYDIEQVRSAVRAGTVGADGQIPGADPVRPPSEYMGFGGRDGLARGFVDQAALASPPSSDASEVRRSLYLDPADGAVGQSLLNRARDAREQVGSDEIDSGKQLIFLIATIAQSGYSMDQIIESLLLQSTGINEADFGCAVLTVGSTVVRPAYRDVGGCADLVSAIADDQDEVHDDREVLPADTMPERAADDPEMRGGTYTGTIDVQRAFAAIGPTYLSVVNELENAVTMVVADGGIASFDAVLHVSNPYVDHPDGTLCPSDDRYAMVAVPGSAISTAASVAVDIEITVIDIDVAEADCDGYEGTASNVVGASVVFSADGATVHVDDFFTIVLTRD